MKSCYICLISILLLAFTGCNEFKNLSPRSKIIVKSKEMLFRGVDFDYTIQSVKAAEEIEPELEYKDYLRFKIKADSIGSGESVDLEYFFNKKDQLDMIIAFYNLTDKSRIEPLANELKRYFERKFGRAQQDEMGWYHWEMTDKSGLTGTVEVNLIGETEEGYMGLELELIKYYENERRLKP